MTPASAACSVVVNADAFKKTRALVAKDARSGTALCPVTSRVQALASKKNLACDNEYDALFEAKLAIERAPPLNRSTKTPASIRHTRDQAEAGHATVERILRERLDRTIAEHGAREDLLRCCPLSLLLALSRLLACSLARLLSLSSIPRAPSLHCSPFALPPSQPSPPSLAARSRSRDQRFSPSRSRAARVAWYDA